jgi:hypothetical protein
MVVTMVQNIRKQMLTRQGDNGGEGRGERGEGGMPG